MNKKQLGAEGERFVCSQLQHQSFTIIDRNWRCRFGEIDIIAKKNNILYFIEVRTRTIHPDKTPHYGYPIEAITHVKINKLKQLATYYCYSKQLDYNYRLIFAPVAYYSSEGRFQLDKLISLF